MNASEGSDARGLQPAPRPNHQLPQSQQTLAEAPRQARKIEVLALQHLTGAGSVKPRVRVRLGGIVVHGVRVIQQPDKEAWVALPQIAWRPKADGSAAGWVPVVEIQNRDLMARLTCAVIGAWKREPGGRP